MTEGWFKDDYLILFAEPEIAAASDRYAISEWLPGYEVVGLRSWGAFIVRNSSSQTYSVPTVAPERLHLLSFALPKDRFAFQPDERFNGKIKFYVQPIRFGGSPEIGENIT